ncbi:MAG: 30S ribosomal protein S8 [Chloroflexota bacterium]|nr:30S ribosomal protein S8 [Chloroflexota bacterium]MDE2942403.1 30S ribosomal protein S8 [Chloroflexota bacterium]MDE3267917.1 30S ribosomal protein S8 [Chloroflexota bacterium]
MNLTDPIADMLTRIRNAILVRRDTVLVPGSNPKVALARIMKDEGFIEDFEILRSGVQRTLRLRLKYRDNKKVPVISGLRRVSKPGLRRYVGAQEIPRIYGGMGVSIISTSQGVMTGSEARRRGIGGEFICYLW